MIPWDLTAVFFALTSPSWDVLRERGAERRGGNIHSQREVRRGGVWGQHTSPQWPHPRGDKDVKGRPLSARLFGQRQERAATGNPDPDAQATVKKWETAPYGQ